MSFVNLGSDLAKHEDIARKCEVIRQSMLHFQNSITSMEKVRLRHDALTSNYILT